MKKISKNFIAFTLSEMMIVLMIVAVMSAVTLPAITGKKNNTPQRIGSVWQQELDYDKGHFYIGGNTHEVMIGRDTSDLASMDNYISAYGHAALHLLRPSSQELVQRGAIYVNYGNADIAFYNQRDKFAGKIAADDRGNIAIGLDAAKQDDYLKKFYGNLMIGHYAASYSNSAGNVDTTSYANTIIGHDAARNTRFSKYNVVIGNDTKDMALATGNVNIGNYAGANSFGEAGCGRYSRQASISIGFYSTYGKCNYVDSISIGSYSGAMPEKTVLLHNESSIIVEPVSSINIGAYSDFYSGYGPSNTDLSVLNIGYYAGAFQRVNGSNSHNLFRFKDMISIGYFAGYSSAATINIGAYSGVFSNNPDYTHVGKKDSINIGPYAGAYNPNVFSNNINIGKYAGYNLTQRGSHTSKMVNIGSYAGAFSGNSENAINIGTWAGYGINPTGTSKGQTYNINIGYASGMTSEYNLGTEGSDSIHIGDEDAYGSNNHQIIIGCYGHNIKAPYRMCIGGKFPTQNNWLTTDNAKYGYNATNQNASGYSSLFLPPGEYHLSNSGFKKTRTFLMAKYLVSWTSSFSSFSDRTLKENIKPTTDGINKVRHINVREYNIKRDKEPRIGIIAQELKEIYPNLVKKTKLQDGNEYYSVNSDRIVYSLAQAVKDVDKMTLNLQREVANNVILIAKLANNVAEIECKLDKLSKSNVYLQKRLNEIDDIISKTEQK